MTLSLKPLYETKLVFLFSEKNPVLAQLKILRKISTGEDSFS